MSKPDDIPQDIWDTAYEVFVDAIRNQRVGDAIIARAILAERERCAQVLLTKHENHPQDGVMWDSTYYDLYEEILQVSR